MSATAELLSADLIAEVEGLALAARSIANGALAGTHRSSRRGSSIEFNEHKVYTPGDDIRHIDWRAFAKSDRVHVKQFEDETNLLLDLLVDHSGSMAYAGGNRGAKLLYAKRLAAALAYLALRQGDSVGLMTFGGERAEVIPTRGVGTHLMEISQHLTRLEPSGETTLSAQLRAYASTRRRPSLVCVLTDFFDPDPHLHASLREVASRRHEVVLWHVLDPDEIDFPFENPSIFASMEDNRRLFVHPRTLQSVYKKQMREFLSKTAETLGASGIEHRLIRTEVPEATVLAEFLRARSFGR